MAEQPEQSKNLMKPFLETPSSHSYPPNVKGTFIFFTKNLVNLFNSKS
jgi:hypothetical protein